MGEKLTTYLQQMSLWIFFGLLAYMPFHIFLSTWIGSSLGVLDFAKVAKDGVLVVGFVITLGLSIRQKWFREILRSKLVWLIIAYAALHVYLALIKPTDQDAEILGLVYNTRFLLYFLYGLLLIRLFPDMKLQRKAVHIVVATSFLVALFGVIQYTLLPNGALSSVGYSRENGVLPAFFIDEKPDLERVMSTLRDPNSLGSYLIITVNVLLAVLFATKRLSTRKAILGAVVLAALCLGLTFSRSALLGFVVAVGVFLFMSNNPVKRWLKQHLLLVSASLVILLVVTTGAFYSIRNTYYAQNVVFHADQSTVLEDPNQLRVRHWQESVLAIVLEPAGTGPGTAGLASIKNDKQGTVLNENYYLQIANEVGILGLLLFLLILMTVAYGLYRRRAYSLPVALLASFAGLAITNFLVHIWSNEAVAYTWWGLAALMFIRKPSKPTFQFKKFAKSL
jgi:O-antigen ligase